MGPIEEALSEALLHALLWGKEADTDFWKILGYGVMRGNLGITDPCKSAENAHSICKAACG